MTGQIPAINTFILSNVAPQFTTHNSESWAKWEKYAISKALVTNGVVFVITGITGQHAMLVEIFILSM